jgi:hypothetical protein
MVEVSHKKHEARGYEAELLSEENRRSWEEKRTSTMSHMEELDRAREAKLKEEFAVQRDLEEQIEHMEHYQESKQVVAELEREELERRIAEENSDEVQQAKANLSLIAAEIRAKNIAE